MKKETADSYISAVELYADVVTMSEFLYEYYMNDRVKLKDILSLAIGLRFHF